MREQIKTSRFPNGLVILTDHMDGVRSVTLGVFVRKGARHEPAELNGITHFIEHAVFKGTAKRSAIDIATEMDRLGGGMDAFTMHEETGFAIKVVDTELESGLDLLGDMLMNALFDEKELKREQKVIIEEIKMTEDNPEDHLLDLFNEEFFPDNPLGLSIAGTPKTVRSFDHAVTSAYHRRLFSPENLVIVAAGNVDHERFVALAKSYFRVTEKAAKRISKGRKPKAGAPVLIKQRKDLEQAHLILSTPFVSAPSPERYAADLLVNIVGGGTSSRLWQKVREERGLAYSVGATAAMYQDCGVFSVYAGTSPKQTREVVSIALEEMSDIVRNGVTEEELALAKAQTVAAILLSLEDSSVRAGTLARMEMVHGRQISIEESIEKTVAVTAKEVKAVAKKYFKSSNIAFGAIGNLKGFRLRREDLAVE
jgi:predicted Zn-dependent peptidase